MTEYKGNSHKLKEEETKREKVIKQVAKGKVQTRKETKLGSIISKFIVSDLRTVSEYVVKDILIPSAKRTLGEMLNNGIDMMLYGEVKPKRRSTSSSRVSYASYYDRDDRTIRRDSNIGRARTSSHDVLLETRVEAEEVLNTLDDLIDQYGVVSVADLYDLVGLTSTNYTDNKYGWTDLRHAEVRRDRDGYLLRMPKATPIK